MMEFKFGSYGYIASKNLKESQRVMSIAPSTAAESALAASEKILKHCVVTLCPHSVERDRILRSHKPKSIANFLNDIRFKDIRSELLEINDLYFEIRYPGDEYHDITVEEAARIFECCKAVFDICVEILQTTKASKSSSSVDKIYLDGLR